MKCVTEVEARNWLGSYLIPPATYSGNATPAHYIQFAAPRPHPHPEAFTRDYFERLIPTGERLFHIVDWALSQPSERLTVAALRVASHEERSLLETPGHILTEAEGELGVALFGLTAGYQWTAYLYSPIGHSTLYNWEGEMFDFWTDSADACQEMKEMLEDFGLSETRDAKRVAQRRSLPRRRPVT
jgi:hypothetical protein